MTWTLFVQTRTGATKIGGVVTEVLVEEAENTKRRLGVSIIYGP